jgi:hypothetical protein
VNGKTGNCNRGNNIIDNDDDAYDDGSAGFGDTMGPLNENHLRIGFQNIGGQRILEGARTPVLGMDRYSRHAETTPNENNEADTHRNEQPRIYFWLE